MTPTFPQQQDGVIYLTEGGSETEIMYKYGFEFPNFSMFKLLENHKAMCELRGMYERYLDVAAEHGVGVLMGGLDYRASPDWAGLLGLSANDLREIQEQCIEFLRDVAKPYQDKIYDIRYASLVGPRGDAYDIDEKITVDEAEEYHSVQIETVSKLGVDFIWAGTFSNIPEAVGVSRAAAKHGVPICVSFILSSNHRLLSGPSLKEAIEAVDDQAGVHKPHFYGINCSHPLEFGPALEPGDWFKRVRSLRPNAAMLDKISLCQLGHLEEGNPVELGQQMGDLAARYPHIDMWGGCCGTWDRHLGEIVRNVIEARASATGP
jgi:S-methylmethionine-dependent homocysteine/selenocysteine methylase